MEVSDQTHALVILLTPRKSPRYPWNRMAEWASEPFWTFWKREESLLPLPGYEPYYINTNLQIE
jgi:hypothetical protein